MNALPDIVIEKGIPMPTGIKRRQSSLLRCVPVSPWVAFVNKLEVGDSFEVDYFSKQTAVRYMKKAGFDFLAHCLGGNQYRVWRTL